MDQGDGWDEWAQGKALIKPPDQLDLTEEVRTSLIPRGMLTDTDENPLNLFKV